MSNDFKILILAAGEGKRMGGDKPKVLTLLNGKPLLHHLLDAIATSGVDSKPIVVIAAGERGQLIKDATQNYTVEYLVQEQQLGTGHAVKVCRPAVGEAASVMVLYGDHPLVSGGTVRHLAEEHERGGKVLTIGTATVSDFNDWRASFQNFGRIIRNKGQVTAIVEVKDAAPEQLEIQEVNPAYFCFRADWLWDNLSKLQTNNAQGEYYLTDLVAMALAEGVATVPIDPIEALGINSPDQLKLIEELSSGGEFSTPRQARGKLSSN